jgi:hypothetical protein
MTDIVPYIAGTSVIVPIRNILYIRFDPPLEPNLDHSFSKRALPRHPLVATASHDLTSDSDKGGSFHD